MTRKLMLICAAAAISVAAVGSSYGFGWALIDAKIRHDFPQVRRISTAELAGWLKDERRPPPLLLDVRTRAEYEVSHLQNARQIEPDAPAAVLNTVKDQPIVTYCSVGYRSGAYADRLRAAGFVNVVNLEGSIFRWANEGRPMVRDGRMVTEVHPYNGTWGLLLNKSRRANVPAETKH